MYYKKLCYLGTCQVQVQHLIKHSNMSYSKKDQRYNNIFDLSVANHFLNVLNTTKHRVCNHI